MAKTFTSDRELFIDWLKNEIEYDEDYIVDYQFIEWKEKYPNDYQVLFLEHLDTTIILKTLPIFMFSITELVILNLHNNKLEILPDLFDNLTNLKKIYLGNNKLKKIPDSICNLENLELLCIFENELEILPDNIGNLKNLEILYLNNNKLKKIPDSINNLSKLEELDIGDNKLETIPEILFNLECLSKLNIDENNITDMFPINQITNLESLTIDISYSNNLDLTNLTKLEYLDIYDTSYNIKHYKILLNKNIKSPIDKIIKPLIRYYGRGILSNYIEYV